MINLVLITFCDIPLIEKCISSVIDHVDRIIVVDGVFDTFPHRTEESGYSDDGTLEYISNLDKEVVLIVAPGETEVEKRTRYLIGEPGDVYLHLDPDEWVENPEVLHDLPDVDVMYCPMKRTDGNVSFYPRVFKHQEGMRYQGLHHRLVDKDGELIAMIGKTGEKYTDARIPLVIHHDRELRTPDRMTQKEVYYRRLNAREKEVKELLAHGSYDGR
jgi:hypothetical protein